MFSMLVGSVSYEMHAKIRSEEELQADLKHLQQGAENGFMLAMPESLRKLGLTRGSFLEGGTLPDLPALGGKFMQSAMAFMTQLREFNQLLDWDKEHEERQEDGWSRVEELRMNAKKQQDAMDAEMSRLESEQAQLAKTMEEARKQEDDLREARRRRDEAERKAKEAQERLEAERRRTSWSFSARDDPIICPERDGQRAEEFCIEYKGPATVMCFDRLGELQTVDFVGVTDEDGQHPQAPDANFVGEQCRFDVKRREFLYRNVSGQKIADVSCSSNWKLS